MLAYLLSRAAGSRAGPVRRPHGSVRPAPAAAGLLPFAESGPPPPAQPCPRFARVVPSLRSLLLVLSRRDVLRAPLLEPLLVGLLVLCGLAFGSLQLLLGPLRHHFAPSSARSGTVPLTCSGCSTGVLKM